MLQTSLLLAHDWGELHIALMHYNKLYVEIWNALKNPTVSSGSFTDLSLVHFYIGAHEWDLISEVILDVKDPVLLYIYVSTPVVSYKYTVPFFFHSSLHFLEIFRTPLGGCKPFSCRPNPYL